MTYLDPWLDRDRDLVRLRDRDLDRDLERDLERDLKIDTRVNLMFLNKDFYRRS